MDDLPTVSSAEGRPERFTLEETASLTGLLPQIIVQYTEAEYVRALETDAAGTPCFDETGILRLRRIEEMRILHGIDRNSLAYVLRLFDRLESVEQELQILRERLR